MKEKKKLGKADALEDRENFLRHGDARVSNRSFIVATSIVRVYRPALCFCAENEAKLSFVSEDEDTLTLLFLREMLVRTSLESCPRCRRRRRRSFVFNEFLSFTRLLFNHELLKTGRYLKLKRLSGGL